MLQNQYYRIMLQLIAMFFIATMISKYHVAAFSFNQFDSDEKGDYSSLKRLRHLVNKLQRDDDEDLFFETRVDAIGDCTADIIEGYQHNGVQSMGLGGIDTAQRCMDSCDIRESCVGWSYSTHNKNCWGFSSINGLLPSTNVKSGSCVGTSIKTKCIEQRSGQYKGIFEKTLNSIATVKDCMTKCDQLKTCYSWLYDKYGRKCYLSRLVGELITSDGFITGSCLATQKRIRLPDPLKLFRKEVLERHNLKRKQHCSPDLTLDDSLNKISQDLANKLAAIDVIPPVYQSTNIQTVYYNKGDDALTGARVVDCFYDEYKYYIWDNPDFTMTNHFPKIIWKSSKMLGVGRAFTSDRLTMYVVITYDSQNDITKSYKKNVEKKCV